MPHKVAREWPCESCGAIVVKRKRADRKLLCLDCATTRMSTAAIEMMEKRGPAWEAWLASNADGRPTSGA